MRRVMVGKGGLAVARQNGDPRVPGRFGGE